MAEFRCEMSRRRFLAALAATPIAGCEFASIKGEASDEAPFDINADAFSALQNEGGMACISAGVVPLILIRSGDEVFAFDRFCPHTFLDMGPCESNPLPAIWDADTKRLTCQWHVSVFDEDGTVVSGPSPSGLTRYEVEFTPDSGQGRVLLGGSDAEE